VATTDVYSYAQLEGLWENAGGSPAAAPTAAAVAEAESSGRADATSGNPDGGTNVGLWQLDTPGGVGAGYSVQQLENPATNAAVAVKGSGDGSDWGDWQTFVQGTYRQFLQAGVPADTDVASPAGGPVTTTGSGGGAVWYEPWTWFSGAASEASSALQDLSRLAVTGLVVVAGGVLVLWGAGRATGGPRTPAIIERVQGEAAGAAAAAG
jgi:hypothetical protein